LFLAWPTS